MNTDKLMAAFQKNNYVVRVFPCKEAAADYLDQSIDGRSVGFGDSGTLMQLGIYERLRKHNAVHDPLHPKDGKSFEDTAADCMHTQVFLMSVNAASETGELVNMDGTGNRTAGSLYGHEKVYFIIGKNKIAPTLEDAIWRVRNVAAPLNARRLGLKTPCAIKGDKCYDCSSPQRICNGMVIHFKAMHHVEMEIVLVDEDLGL